MHDATDALPQRKLSNVHLFEGISRIFCKQARLHGITGSPTQEDGISAVSPPDFNLFLQAFRNPGAIGVSVAPSALHSSGLTCERCMQVLPPGHEWPDPGQPGELACHFAMLVAA